MAKLTFMDEYDRLIDKFKVTVFSGQPHRNCLRAVMQGLSHLVNLHSWPSLVRDLLLVTDEDYSSGQITYESATRIVTLSGGVFPVWARFGVLSFGDYNHRVVSRIDDTHVVISENYSGILDVPVGVPFTLRRIEYVLPDNFKKVLSVDTVPSAIIAQVSQKVMGGLGVTGRCNRDQVTVMGSEVIPGRLALRVSTGRALRSALVVSYQARPRALNYCKTTKGTIHVDAIDDTQLICSESFFQEAMVGSIVRVSESDTVPVTGIYGADGSSASEEYNPFVYEAYIVRVISDTVVEMSEPCSLGSAERTFTVTDEIEMPDVSCMLALQACVDAAFSASNRLDDQIVLAKLAQEEVRRARENASYMPHSYPVYSYYTALWRWYHDAPVT